MSRRLLCFLALVLIVATGGALRLWYASSQLHPHRFEDERYSLQNVRKIFLTGDLQPASGYYPSPVFNLPQVWALRASEGAHAFTERPAFDAVDPDGRLRPTGILLTRGVESRALGERVGPLAGPQRPDLGQVEDRRRVV
ncbi:MAG: hypothetical protein AAF725_07790, partial [Acidobacteriota bacterium]